jgi:hypothetical protein
MEALVIRTLYENCSWQAPCKNPWTDHLNYFCRNNKLDLNIQPPSPCSNPCDGKCWEQSLCNNLYWGCTPQGNFWSRRASEGMRVFFVFRQDSSPRKYTLWGKTFLKHKDASLNTSGIWGRHGYHLIHFEPFCPSQSWVANLSSNAVVGKPWGKGNYRYIDAQLSSKLENMIK